MEHIEIGNCPKCGHFPTQFIDEDGEVKGKALNSLANSAEALDLIDSLAVSLTDYGHTWTPEQRRLFEKVSSALKD